MKEHFEVGNPAAEAAPDFMQHMVWFIQFPLQQAAVPPVEHPVDTPTQVLPPHTEAPTQALPPQQAPPGLTSEPTFTELLNPVTPPPVQDEPR